MDIRNWEQRNSDIALYETSQAQRENIKLCGKLKMRSILFQESRARNCQEIEELRRICCEETNRPRQLRIDELSVQQERNPSTVSQLLTQIQDWQNKVNSLTDAREFYDPETASSSAASHFPNQSLNISSPTGVLCRDSGWPGGWGPEGMSRRGGGEPARIPNLRVCEHLNGRWHTQGEKGENTRLVVAPSSRRD